LSILKPPPVTRCLRAALGPVAWAAVILAVAFWPAAVCPQSAADSEPSAARNSADRLVNPGATGSEYLVRARAFLFGDMGTVGTALLERRLEWKATEVVKTSRFSGRSKPELARKGRDIGGELTTVTCRPSKADGETGRTPVEAGRAGADSCSWVLANNGVAKTETITFYPDHALSMKGNGSEIRFNGRFESLLSWLEFFLDNPFRPGDVHQSRFILDGHPFLFKCEVGEPEVLKPYGKEAYRIDLTMYDGRLLDGGGNPKVVKKKGAIRIWLRQDGEHRNEFLRLSVQYKWYLTLVFDLVETAGRSPAVSELSP